jgi:hypothetical protein
MSQRHSTLMQVTARWLLLGLTIAVLPSCETTSDGAEPAVRLVADVAADPATPRFEPSQVILETFVSDAEPYCPPGRDNCCPTWLTDLGTKVPTEDIAAFFEWLGFDGQGAFVDENWSLSPGGRLLRWAGERGSGTTEWRRVDISDGAGAGHPGGRPSSSCTCQPAERSRSKCLERPVRASPEDGD